MGRGERAHGGTFQTAQPKSGPDSFAAFFHPEKLATAAGAEAAASGSTTTSIGAGQAAGAKLDINSAASAELLDIPGVGPVLAQRIVDGRPFQTADELTRVKGVGAKTYARIRPHFQ